MPFWREVPSVLSESFERVENYLKDVDEQISCKIGLD